MMKKKSQEQKIQEALTKQVEKIYPSREALQKVLESGKKLMIYWGADPTGPDFHLGHSTNFFILRRFQNLGHKIVILIGDYTAQIGDPSGKDKTRRVLTEKEVKRNYQTYKQQILKILNSKTIFQFNSEWWDKMKASDLLKLDSLVTHQQIIERDMFQKRIAANNPISEMEIQYPLLQGYDSVALKADVEVGGTDQLFNMLMGRELEKTLIKKEKFVITTPLLENPKTGKKLMSKSEGNYISMDDKPNNMYGKVMALPDEVILPCFKMCTDLPDEKIKEVESSLISGKNPRDIKSELARELVKIYHGEKKSKQAAEEFERVFRKHELPENIPVVSITIKPRKIEELLMQLHPITLVTSRSQARPLIEGNAVKVDKKIINIPGTVINVREGMIVQVGKRRIVEVGKK